MIEQIDKLWGWEEILVSNDLYTLKRLVLNKGFRCSLHYHQIKDETFYIEKGHVIIQIKVQDTLKEEYKEAGDIIRIKPCVAHRFWTLDEQSSILEVSTKDIEEDSYRLIPSEKYEY